MQGKKQELLEHHKITGLGLLEIPEIAELVQPKLYSLCGVAIDKF